MSRTVYYNLNGEDVTEDILDELDEIIADALPKEDIFADPKMYTRQSVLSEAERVICSDRQDQYGNAEDSFDIIASYWNVYLEKRLNVKITAYDVARMMTLLKIARSMSNPNHLDNDIDICGYTAIAAELAYEEWANEHKS